MHFDIFDKKKELLKNLDLIGYEAQYKLAPEFREIPNLKNISAKKPRKAAVLALFYPDKNNNTHMVLTLRANYKGTHASQISFPGGKFDKIDNSLSETAKRECFEEIGIQQKEITILKEISDIYIPPSNFLVTPFIGSTDITPNFTKNYEVEELIEISLEDLLYNTPITYINKDISYAKNIKIPHYNIKNHIVWGATAMIISEIKELLNSL